MGKSRPGCRTCRPALPCFNENDDSPKIVTLKMRCGHAPVTPHCDDRRSGIASARTCFGSSVPLASRGKFHLAEHHWSIPIGGSGATGCQIIS